jgi:hypothetical protein
VSKLLFQPALLIDWRRRAGTSPGRGTWQLYQSALIINWRAAHVASSSGGGSPDELLAGEAEGVGNAQAALVGPAEVIAGEADGLGNAQIAMTVGATLRCEGDGIGNAQIFLGGGIVSIACLTSGSVGGSPATPQSTVLYDAPAAW